MRVFYCSILAAARMRKRSRTVLKGDESSSDVANDYEENGEGNLKKYVENEIQNTIKKYVDIQNTSNEIWQKQTSFLLTRCRKQLLERRREGIRGNMWNDSSEFFAHHYNNTSTVDKLFVIRNQGFIIISILNVPLDDLVVKRFSDIKFILSVLRWLAIMPHIHMRH